MAASGSLPSAVCPTFQDNAICSVIAATNIASISYMSQWSCTSDGTTSTDPCDDNWDGVVCSGGYISSLFLNSMEMTGTFPSMLTVLSTLRHISLASNSLDGTLPTEIGALVLLTYLSVDGNGITGTVPEQIAQLPVLKKLLIHANKLTGNKYSC